MVVGPMTSDHSSYTTARTIMAAAAARSPSTSSRSETARKSVLRTRQRCMHSFGRPVQVILGLPSRG